MKNMSYLKLFRERHGLSQDELARKLSRDGFSVSQKEISRMELDPSLISLPLILEIQKTFGVGLNEFISSLSSEKVQPYSWLDGNDPYASLREKITDARKVLEKTLLKKVPDPLSEASLSAVKLKRVLNLNYKPTIALFGKFDSGKSTLINSFLGESILPSSFGPTTKLNIILAHKDDKPDWFGALHDVKVFNKDFDPLLWRDEESLKHEIFQGQIESLQSFANKKDNKYKEKLAEGQYVVAYVDAEILKLCNIMDTPGFGSADKTDSELQKITAEKLLYDVAILTSPFISFMDDRDVLRAKEVIERLKSKQGKDEINEAFLRRFYIAITHLHREAEEDFNREKEAIVRSIFISLSSSIGVEPNDNKSFEAFFSQFIEFNPKYNDYRIKLFNKIKKDLNNLSTIYLERFEKGVVPQFLQKERQDLSRKKKLIEKKHKLLLIKKWHKDKGEAFKDQNDKKVKVIHKKIEDAEKAQLMHLNTVLEKYRVTDFLINCIYSAFEKLPPNKRKEAAEKGFSIYLIGEIQKELNEKAFILAEPIIKDIQSILDNFEHYLENFKVDNEKIEIPFDANALFLSSLAGTSTYGALSIWVASLGNLGGYIGVAKVVSLLSTMGISVGGTATAIAGVSALGGPFTFLIATALLAVFGFWKLLTESWEQRLAKKIEKELQPNSDLYNRLTSHYSKYWKDTRSSFDRSYLEVLEKFEYTMENVEKEIPTEDLSTMKDVDETLAALDKIIWE